VLVRSINRSPFNPQQRLGMTIRIKKQNAPAAGWHPGHLGLVGGSTPLSWVLKVNQTATKNVTGQRTIKT